MDSNAQKNKAQADIDRALANSMPRESKPEVIHHAPIETGAPTVPAAAPEKNTAPVAAPPKIAEPPVIGTPAQAPGNSQPPSKPQSKLKSLMFLELGLLEIGFVIIILLLFFGVLNFFNILSLSSIYPTQLGWLPHIQKNSSTTNQIVNLTPITASEEQQAKDELMSMINKDSSYKTSFVDPETQLQNIKGLTFSFKNNNLELITAEGDKTFTLNEDSAVSMPTPTPVEATDSGTLALIMLTPPQYASHLYRGKSLNVYYQTTPQGINVIKEAYIE